MGPLATTVFHRFLILNTAAGRDQDHLHVLVDSDPSIPDRTAFLVGDGEDPRPAITRAAQRLVDAGAELLVMPCNTANAFADDVERAVGIRLVPWLETAIAGVLARAPVGADVRCGLLATTGTLRAGLYARMIRSRGGELIEPDEAHQRDVMTAIYGGAGVKGTGQADDAAREGILRAARHLEQRGANVLLLGCTELPIAISADDPRWPVAASDPVVEVARRTIVEAGGEVVPVPMTA
jgi:aspartate racemase